MCSANYSALLFSSSAPCATFMPWATRKCISLSATLASKLELNDLAYCEQLMQHPDDLNLRLAYLSLLLRSLQFCCFQPHLLLADLECSKYDAECQNKIYIFALSNRRMFVVGAHLAKVIIFFTAGTYAAKKARCAFRCVVSVMGAHP